MNTYENLGQSRPRTSKNGVKIKIGKTYLNGKLFQSIRANSIVLIMQHNSHGSYKSCNQYIAKSLYIAGISTLLIDLLTDNEQKIDSQSYSFRFNSDLLAKRLIKITNWLQTHPVLGGSKITYFGTGIDVAPILVAATVLKNKINAVITNGGRPDLVENVLSGVTCPTLLVVPDSDKMVVELNKLAYKNMKCEKSIKFVDAQSNYLEDPNKLYEIAQFVSVWLEEHNKPEIKWI